MARPMRIEYPGAVHHIRARGNERKKIFWDGHDREIFLNLMKQVKDRFYWLFHSYVRMGSRDRLLVGMPEASLSRGHQEM
jgi:putative transposase